MVGDCAGDQSRSVTVAGGCREDVDGASGWRARRTRPKRRSAADQQTSEHRRDTDYCASCSHIDLWSEA
jgi:hypothetical protein